jgi:alkylation response protein AidB-like acyl-CoA dehydrogenase
MDFEFSDEQLGLRDATRRLLAASGSVASTRQVVDAGTGFDRALWRKGAELGWPALAIPEAHGGYAQQVVDLAVIANEHGRVVLPSPFIPTVVVADAIARSTNETLQQLLPAIADGSVTAAWAFATQGRAWAPTWSGVLATRTADGFVLRGERVSVQDAGTADWILVDAELDGAPARLLVAGTAPGITVTRQSQLDITRELDDVSFADVPVPASALLAEGDEAALSGIASLQRATVLICAELVGIGERLLEMTVEYSKVRVQFGRPIGSFQAIKHKCATMRIWLQASTAATYYAAMAVDADAEDAARAVSVAKAYVSDAIAKLAGEALQTHGGIGFTWEHDLHLYLRRAKANELLWGDPAWHRELLCRDLERPAV